MRRAAAVVTVLACLQTSPSLSQTTGSAGCAALTQAAAAGLSARVKADDASIRPPRSIIGLTCLDGLFGGVGLNVVADIFNPGTIIDAVKGKICAAVQSAWNSALGSVQCGLTVTGFDLGFDLALGGGTFCPALSFGGSGPPIGSVGAGLGAGGSSVYLNGHSAAPSGYPQPPSAGN